MSSNCDLPKVTKLRNMLHLQDFNMKDARKDSYTIRGIKYVENADELCVPLANITKGGIDQKFAEVKVTSASGCGLDSVIIFLAE